jgi:hypothetical protein
MSSADPPGLMPSKAVSVDLGSHRMVDQAADVKVAFL